MLRGISEGMRSAPRVRRVVTEMGSGRIGGMDYDEDER